MASTISAQDVVWVQPVDSPPYETPVTNTATQWKPYRDASQRIDLLPPVDFNLEQDTFASEPIAGPDPIEPSSSRRKKPSFGRGAPLSMGGFWAPNTPVVNQPANLQMNAQFARAALPIGIPEEGQPLWLAIAKFGRLELATDAILPIHWNLCLVNSGWWKPESLNCPLASGSTVVGTFLWFGE